jgi:predicted N-formylglutamate amidohydrolase
MPLLSPADPSPVVIDNPDGCSPFLLIGDHAGTAIPAALGDLGVSAADRARHIGWDIGIAVLGALLAALLDVPFVHQAYSRLVIDCNRDPDRADAIPEISDNTRIPGNVGLTAADCGRRVAEIHAPYQAAIAGALLGRQALISLHSFTPVMADRSRPWHAGILHNGGNDRLARAMLAALQAEGDLAVGDNEPYAMAGIDHTVPRHAFAAGLPYAEIEIRQDLIADPAGQQAWADRLARLLPAALATLG